MSVRGNFMEYLFSKMRDDALNITKFENNFFKYNNFFFILYNLYIYFELINITIYNYYYKYNYYYYNYYYKYYVIRKMLIKKKIENQSSDFFQCNKINTCKCIYEFI